MEFFLEVKYIVLLSFLGREIKALQLIEDNPYVSMNMMHVYVNFHECSNALYVDAFMNM